jgi:hypothetical protein
MRIRQVALCTDDIWREEQLIVAELGVAAVHRDPPNVFEMRNTVFAVADTFLEVLQPESPSAPSARFLERRGGGGRTPFPPRRHRWSTRLIRPDGSARRVGMGRS